MRGTQLNVSRERTTQYKRLSRSGYRPPPAPTEPGAPSRPSALGAKAIQGGEGLRGREDGQSYRDSNAGGRPVHGIEQGENDDRRGVPDFENRRGGLRH